MAKEARIKVPGELEGLLVTESCEDFPEDRYFLTQNQLDIFNDIVANKNVADEMREMGVSYMNSTLLYGPPGTGKSQPLSALVLTPDGYVHMGDIKKGSRVIAANGSVTTVEEIFPQGELDVYEVVFDGGQRVRCSHDHLWKVGSHRRSDGEKVMSLKDILAYEEKYNWDSEHRLAVSTPGRIDFAEKRYIIPPFIMGLVLTGRTIKKGNLRVNITSDAAVKHVKKLDKTLQITGCKGRDRAYVLSGDISGYEKELSRLGLLGVQERERSIPGEYLLGSYEQRMELLRGILASKAEINKGHIRVRVHSFLLADDIATLVRSLSGKSMVSEHERLGRDTVYSATVIFTGKPLLFYDKNLQESTQIYDRPPLRNIIKSIKKVGREKCQCILVKDKEHMYVTNEYIPTHNTHFARWVAHSLDMDLAYVNFAKLVDGVFGNTARNLSKIFKFMQDEECVFLLDEIDCIAVKRGTESAVTGGELSRITITLMQEMDYYRSRQVQAIVMAATNRLDQVDPALLSRFSIKRMIKGLSNQEKYEYITQYLDRLGIPYDPQNINEYVLDTVGKTNRITESDISRCIADWILKGKKKYILNTIMDDIQY